MDWLLPSGTYIPYVADPAIVVAGRMDEQAWASSLKVPGTLQNGASTIQMEVNVMHDGFMTTVALSFFLSLRFRMSARYGPS